MKNPYEVLGVSKNATGAEIKSAYRKMVMTCHPDKHPWDKSAEEKFKEVNNAFDILKDPQKKAAYDRFGDAAFGAGNGASAGSGFNANPFGGGGFGGFEFNMGGFDMSDMMDEVLKGFGFETGRSRAGGRAASGRDMLHDIVIDLKDAYYGTTQTVKFSSNTACEKCNGHGTRDGKPAEVCKTCRGTGTVRTRGGFFATERPCPDCGGIGRMIKEKCDACHGSGVVNKNRSIDVKIPSGVTDGARLRMPGMGEAAPFGGRSGDFYIDIHIRPHPLFQRIGSDLIMRANISFATLALGGEIEITTISDKKLSVKIPSGTPIGDRLRVRSAGMPAHGGTGDLYIEIATTVPSKLSRAQKRALEEFSQAS